MTTQQHTRPKRPSLVYVAVAAADIALAATGRSKARWMTKPLLMPTLLIGRDRPTQRALALGGAADVALLGESSAAFTAGLGTFLVGHVAWIVALRGRGETGWLRRNSAAGAPYVVAWAGLNAYLWRLTGRDRYPVLAYSTLLAAMALTALDTGRPVKVAGGLPFVTSSKAMRRFGCGMGTLTMRCGSHCADRSHQRTTSGALPDGVRMYFATRMVEWDVGNGGFEHAVECAAEYFADAVTGYRLLGDQASVRLLQRVQAAADDPAALQASPTCASIGTSSCSKQSA